MPGTQLGCPWVHRSDLRRGDLKINGHAWVLGAVVVRGHTEVKATGNSTMLFSRDAVVQSLARLSGQFETLSWREIP